MPQPIFIPKHIAGLFCLLVAFGSTPATAATEVPPWQEETLSGDWGGTRAKLFEKGITLDFTHRSDVFNNLDGGIQRGSGWLGYTDMRADFDLEKLYGWSGMEAYLQFHSTLGGKPNKYYVSSTMGVDNIEVSANTAQFYHAWVQKNLLDDRLSVRFGLYPVDSEFYVTDTSGLFLHPSLGMAAEVAQSGRNGPPIYPLGSLGMRVKYTSPDHTTYLQAALLDGIPGDPADPYGTQIKLNSGDGTFAIMEIGCTPLEAKGEPSSTGGDAAQPEAEAFNKTAFGLWQYSNRFDDLSQVDAAGAPLQQASFGWYMLAERTLLPEAGNANNGLAGFLRYGSASADIHQSDWSASAGLRYRGLLSGRDDDIAGIVVTVSHASTKYRDKNLSAERETAIEATYRIQLKPWLGVQPLIQRIIAPGMNPAVSDSTLLGARMEVFL